MLDLPPLGCRIARETVFVGALGVGVGDLNGAGNLVGRERQENQLSILGCAEQRLAIVEIFGEFFDGRSRNVAGHRQTEHDVVDAAFFVLVTVECLDSSPGHRNASDQRIFKLLAQSVVTQLGDVARLGETRSPDRLLEPLLIELAIDAAKCRILHNPPPDLVVPNAEAQRARALVEGGLRHHLFQDLSIDAQSARLLGRDRATDLALELLQLVRVCLPKLFSRDLGVTHGRDGRAPAAPKNVGDAPDPEADDQEADNGRHDGFAEPIGRGFAQTSKHEATTLMRLGKRPVPPTHNRDA